MELTYFSSPSLQYINNPVYAYPQQQQQGGYVAGPWNSQCYNNLGEGVECRTDFSENLNLGYY